MEFIQLVLEFYLIIVGLTVTWSQVWGGLGWINNKEINSKQIPIEYKKTKYWKILLIVANFVILYYAYLFSKVSLEFPLSLIYWVSWIGLFSTPFLIRALFETINCYFMEHNYTREGITISHADKNHFYNYRKHMLYVGFFILLSHIITLSLYLIKQSNL